MLGLFVEEGEFSHLNQLNSHGKTAVSFQSCYNSHMAIEKVVRKVKIDEQVPDSVYWRTQSYQARLAALEQIRQDYHQWKYGTRRPRLQRVYTIIKQ